MKYNAEQVAFMLHEAIDENREYKSWHCSTQHLMTLVERVVAEEREKVTKERDRMCKHCKWKNDENSTLDETNQSKVLGKG